MIPRTEAEIKSFARIWIHDIVPIAARYHLRNRFNNPYERAELLLLVCNWVAASRWNYDMFNFQEEIWKHVVSINSHMSAALVGYNPRVEVTDDPFGV